VKCRFCGAPHLLPFVDLGVAPPSNALLGPENLSQPEAIYPLRVGVCPSCWLAQTEDFVRREDMFAPDYHYTSSTSETWLAHCARFVAGATKRFGLGANSRVVEIAANDGYLLHYVKDAGIPCYGIEPTRRVADAARAKGLPIVEAFFGVALANKLRAEGAADLLIANNVLAHVPDINDFVQGFSILLKPSGVASFEFPHLVRLVKDSQFDTIYHEHYSYLSFAAAERIFAANGLAVFDVETLPTHGGSLRVFTQIAGGPHSVTPAVGRMRALEQESGVEEPSFYIGLQARAAAIRSALVGFLRQKKAAGEKVAAYGAAAKGNTLLNFAEVGTSLLPYIVDRDPAKQGKFTPGGHIPIVDVTHLRTDRPAWILILPWNIKDEIANQLGDVRAWGAKMLVAVPELGEV